LEAGAGHASSNLAHSEFTCRPPSSARSRPHAFGFKYVQIRIQPRGYGRAIVDRARSALIRQEQRSPERIIEASKMTSAQPRLKTLVEMIGFALIVVLLGALVRTGKAFAQCGRLCRF
jgi:hypothetical protein